MAGAQSKRVQKFQHHQLREYQNYIIRRYASDCRTGLDVGCGSGLLLSYLGEGLELKGLDIDAEQIMKARKLGLDVLVADGTMIPFADSSFDMVFCSFYLMWVEDIHRALKEMIRVSRKKVLVLAEPVWSSTLIEPAELQGIVDLSMENIHSKGGDPDSGSAMLNSMARMGLDLRYGTIPVDTSMNEVSKYLENEIMIHGGGRSVPEPLLFHVPFIWAVIDVSG